MSIRPHGMSEKEWVINGKLSDILLFDSGKAPFWKYNEFYKLWKSFSDEERIIAIKFLYEDKDKLPWKDILEYVKINMGLNIFE